MLMLPLLLLRALYTRSHSIGGEKPLETSDSVRGQSFIYGPSNPQISLPSFHQTQACSAAPLSMPISILPHPAAGLPCRPPPAQSHAVMDVINICSESSRSFRACFEPLIVNVSIWAPFFLVTPQLYLGSEASESASQWPNPQEPQLRRFTHLWERTEI